MKKRLIDKKLKKRMEKRCYFCGCDNYATLDVHRIIPGGEYSDFNTIVVCCKCHRKIHAGQIQIRGKHFSTAGRYVVIYLEDGQEKML